MNSELGPELINKGRGRLAASKPTAPCTSLGQCLVSENRVS